MRNRLWPLFGEQGFLATLRPRNKRLKLRFGVNQVAAQLRGVDCRKPVMSIEVDPSQLSSEDRRLLDQRMLGIDVCEALVRADGSRGPRFTWDKDTYQDPYQNPSPVLLVAELPTLQGLLEAMASDERRLLERDNMREPALRLVANS